MTSIAVFAWTIVRVRSSDTCHVLGYRADTGRGRSSSPVRSFDPARRIATTSSGYRYVFLGGASEVGLDDPLVLQWLEEGDLTVRDVAIVAIADL